MFIPITTALLANAVFWILRVQNSGGSFPRPLNAEEETQALQDLTAGDPAARDLLIEHNLRLVAHIVKKYYAASVEQDDLISIGTIGLIKAISTFQPDKNVRLATYAARCIENEILMFFRSTKKTANDVSLSETLDTDADGNSLALMDIISCEDEGLQRVETSDRYIRMYEAIADELEPREREILRLRYGLSGAQPLTQRETAKCCGISRSYISRLEKKALLKLRSALERP